MSVDTTRAVVLKETGGIVGCAGYHLTAKGNITHYITCPFLLVGADKEVRVLKLSLR